MAETRKKDKKNKNSEKIALMFLKIIYMNQRVNL